jgi:hypothetical protein
MHHDADQSPMDLVVTVCDEAAEECPFFPGAKRQEHWGVPDPSAAIGTEEKRLAAFRAVRDAIAALGSAHTSPRIRPRLDLRAATPRGCHNMRSRSAQHNMSEVKGPSIAETTRQMALWDEAGYTGIAPKPDPRCGFRNC